MGTSMSTCEGVRQSHSEESEEKLNLPAALGQSILDLSGSGAHCYFIVRQLLYFFCWSSKLLVPQAYFKI